MLLAHTPIMVHFTILRSRRAFVKPFRESFYKFLIVSASKEFFAFEAYFSGKKKRAEACTDSRVDTGAEKARLKISFSGFESSLCLIGNAVKSRPDPTEQ